MNENESSAGWDDGENARIRFLLFEQQFIFASAVKRWKAKYDLSLWRIRMRQREEVKIEWQIEDGETNFNEFSVAGAKGSHEL